MGAIPESTLPGHRRLHERAVVALERCQEEPEVDFKESAPWDSLKWRITHSSLGMANLRDGGMLLIGVAEQDQRWLLHGIESTHLATYNPDEIAAHLNAHASPHIDVDIVSVQHETRSYLAIHVREFRDTPIVVEDSRRILLRCNDRWLHSGIRSSTFPAEQ
jgi:predicted HTH transcriptional regulator